MTTTTELPEVKCPNCGALFHEDDYYNIEAGMELECPACKWGIQVLDVNPTITIRVGTERGQ